MNGIGQGTHAAGKGMRRQHRFSALSRRRRLFFLLIFAAVVVVLLAGAYLAGRWYENKGYTDERQRMSENFGKLHTVAYQGQTYLRRPEVSTLLIMGVDQRDGSEITGYRSGGQADFLMLLAIDSANRQVHQLQVDRDAITEVPIVGVLGNQVGTRQMQICLAHAYGGSEEERSRHTVQALANLLGGETAGHVISVRLDGIGRLNSLLGGVTVTVPADYSQLDPAMTKGAVLTLNDAQAELLVRSRMTIEGGTNAERMVRQRSFMNAVIQKIRGNVKENADFAGTLFDILDEISDYTDLQRGEMINEVTQALTYDILPVETLTGEYTIGSDGFVEFHADEDAVAAWVLQTLYEPKK